MWSQECNSGPWTFHNDISPHIQLSAKIIILYAFHTHRRIKSKFPSHINSIYLSDIFCGTKVCATVGLWKQLTSSILTVRAFPANTAHSPNVGLMSANVADVGLTLKQHLANFSLEQYLVISSVADINDVKVYSIG